MAPQIGSTPQHCPGFQQLKSLSSFICKCSECGAENEIFSDEFDKPRSCESCKKPIDFSTCSIDASAGANDPR